ncbi:MAG: DUF1223 domain-containing protein [Bryobacteraceae bacterium]|jgi:hypothetical protein
MKHWRGSCALLLAATLPAAAGGADRAPVLVELFTSEGCSSCPPADQLLERLDPAAVVLSEHVTYWDHEGWRDRFSLDEVTIRQQGYAQRFHLDSPYTPEMVIDGAVEFNGSDARRAADEIGKASILNKAVTRLAWADRGVRIEIDGAPEGDLVFLALADASDSTAVSSGENKGRQLHHVAVCREIRRAGKVPRGGAFSRLIQLPQRARRQRVIVWTQSGDAGAVAGAALLVPEHGEAAAEPPADRH